MISTVLCSEVLPPPVTEVTRSNLAETMKNKKKSVHLAGTKYKGRM